MEIESKREAALAEQDELLSNLRKIPESAVRALAKIQRRLAEVDEEVAVYERRLENAADQFRAADDEWDRLNREWEAAQVAMDNDVAARRRVEAVRRVVSRIVVTFVLTGKKKPLGRMKSVDVYPNISGESDVRPCESEYRSKSRNTATHGSKTHATGSMQR